MEDAREKLQDLTGVKVPHPVDDVNLTRVLRDNLAPDLRFWSTRPKSRVRQLIRLALQPRITNKTNARRLVLIQDNKFAFPLMEPGLQTECAGDCDRHMRGFVKGMEYAISAFGIKLPDMLFLLNVDDHPACYLNDAANATHACSVPVLGLSKHLGSHADILGPSLLGPDAQDVRPRTLPWGDKKAQAFFRGVGTCGRTPIEDMCARTWFARLASTTHGKRVDAGLVEPYWWPQVVDDDPVLRDGHGPLPVLPHTPLSVLPEYRYLLALDGYVAPYRTALLLATNSVVLKQQSSWVEWYYRSLKPGAHYIPILTKSKWDALDAMDSVDANPQRAQAIAARATRFALRYATFKPRVLYWLYTLHGYRRLFADQDEVVSGLKGMGERQRRQVLLSLAPPSNDQLQRHQSTV